jgi:hypothetical protein
MKLELKVTLTMMRSGRGTMGGTGLNQDTSHLTRWPTFSSDGGSGSFTTKRKFCYYNQGWK